MKLLKVNTDVGSASIAIDHIVLITKYDTGQNQVGMNPYNAQTNSNKCMVHLVGNIKIAVHLSHDDFIRMIERALG